MYKKYKLNYTKFLYDKFQVLMLLFPLCFLTV